MFRHRTGLRKARILYPVGLALALAACTTAETAQPDVSKLDLPAYQEQEATYVVCVAVNVIRPNGSVAQSAVDPALHHCSTAGLTKVLAKASCTDTCARFVIQVFQAQTRQWVAKGLQPPQTATAQ